MALEVTVIDTTVPIDLLRGFEAAPRMTFITHGEPAAADALRLRIQDELGWPATVPEHGQVSKLS